MSGGSGNDSLDGGAGNDTLMGTDAVAMGLNEIDVLTGGAGADQFQLGDGAAVFYRDADVLSTGEQDYARIMDFNPAEDMIQLTGSAAQYSLGSFDNGQSSAVWYQESSNQPELIAVLDQVAVSQFSQGFSFV